MVDASSKKTDDDKTLKWKRDVARKNLNQGKYDYEWQKNWRLAEKYRSGALQTKYEEAEKQWSRAKQRGVAALLGPGMGD